MLYGKSYCFHFTHGETEAQRGNSTYQGHTACESAKDVSLPTCLVRRLENNVFLGYKKIRLIRLRTHGRGRGELHEGGAVSLSPEG